MGFENNWGANRAADAEYGKSFDPTPEQVDAANKILEGGSLDGVTLEGDEEDKKDVPNWPSKN